MIAASKLELFINRMLQNDEQMRWGFELLVKREDFTQFFDPLQAAGLFAAKRSPKPVPAKNPGYVHIPYWPALDYLEACAKRAGEQNDIALGNNVMTVIREVSAFVELDGSPRQNYHTNRKFAEMLGLLPTEVTTLADMDFVQHWLADRLDCGLVCNALDKGAMHRFLNSERAEDWDKALRIVLHCTALAHADDRDEERTVVDADWLEEFIEHQAANIGTKVGAQAAAIFLERLQEIFGSGIRSGFSYLFRPAVEEHEQNHPWRTAENCMVQGFRDVLLAWVNAEAGAAIAYVENLLIGDLEIARRIALHVVDCRWQVMSPLFSKVLGPALFEYGHLHELYWLLSNHFTEMPHDLQTSVIAAISNLPVPEQIEAEDKPRYRRELQRTWLSAIAGKGNSKANQLEAELASGENAVGLSKHPDFLSYREFSSANGFSPYQVQELIAFAKDNSLIETLNNFQPTGRWGEPTIRSLVDTLEEAVLAEPKLFLRMLPHFFMAKSPYQYGVINGLKRVWEKTPSEAVEIDWDDAWERILNFLTELVATESFWSQEITNDAVMTPTRNWIPPVAADLLHSGSRDDAHAYTPSLLPQAGALIELLLARARPEQSSNDDPMTQAINSSKGKAIGALFSYALRVCRYADSKVGEHTAEWQHLKPLFDSELAKCIGSNYEFSTLAAAYLANLEYLDFAWLEENIKQIFPIVWPDNFKSAIGGLAYAQPTKRGYVLMVNAGVVDTALKLDSSEWQPKLRLIERVSLAYLWGDENLASPRFRYWFDVQDEDALSTVSHYFWSVRNQSLKTQQIELIKAFWHACLSWAESVRPPPGKLLSNLSKLVCYVDQIGESEQSLLLTVAPYCNVNYNATEFIENLDRLAANNPQVVHDSLVKLIESHEPTYDYEDRLQSIIRKLVAHGLREEAMVIANSLRKLPGMQGLYMEISKCGG